MEETAVPYQVRLERFEGPLDLLLHLIKKNEINIYDIPIALITKQYLEYISMIKSFNLTVAGEFLVVAATLVYIKAKMLLPVEEGDEDDEEGIDPREELVARLLEYKRFKEAASDLDHRERTWREVFARQTVPPPPVKVEDVSLDTVTLFDLVDALQDVLKRLPDPRFLEISAEQLTVKDRMNEILEVLEGHGSIAFLDLFEPAKTKLMVIVTFLALLELIRLRLVRAYQPESFGSILVVRGFSPGEGELSADYETLTEEEA